MSWLDTLRDRGMQAKRDVRPVATIARAVVPRQPSADIKLVWVQTRSPRDGDAGEVDAGYYSVFDGVLTMRDEKGKPIGKEHYLSLDEDPHRVAGRLTRQAWQNSHDATGFNRSINYQPFSIA